MYHVRRCNRVILSENLMYQTSSARCLSTAALHVIPRAHKNGQLEERVTPIEAHSPGKIIELLLKIEHPAHACLATVHNSLCQCGMRRACYYF